MTIEAKRPKTEILGYPCNVVGYIRIVWLVATVAIVAVYRYYGAEPSFWLRFWLSIGLIFPVNILDMVDGYLARKYGHSTQFGAVFELVIDLLCHTGVWYLSGLPLAYLFIAIEWTTGIFIAIFAYVPNDSWKTTLRDHGPWFVRVYFVRSKGIRVINNYSNGAHIMYPLVYFTFQEFNTLSWIALPGLIMFEVVSLYMIYTFAKLLLVMEGEQT